MAFVQWMTLVFYIIERKNLFHWKIIYSVSKFCLDIVEYFQLRKQSKITFLLSFQIPTFNTSNNLHSMDDECRVKKL